MLASHSAHGKQILQKQRRMDIAQEMLMTFNDFPDLLKKVIRYVWLWHWNQSPGIIGNDDESVQKSEDRKKLIKLSQM